jgi:uncharacterized protein (DUF1697 family)
MNPPIRYVALFRGINVGGNKKIAMADLRTLLSSLGYADVATYINSGNAVFTSQRDDPDALAREIEDRIAGELGMRVTVLVRTREDLAAVVERNPFADTATSPTSLHHILFLSAQPDAERLSEMQPYQFSPDEFVVGDRIIYLRLPNGVAGATLTYDFWERRFGLRATSRTLNTVTKLLRLAS